MHFLHAAWPQAIIPGDENIARGGSDDYWNHHRLELSSRKVGQSLQYHHAESSMIAWGGVATRRYYLFGCEEVLGPCCISDDPV